MKKITYYKYQCENCLFEYGTEKEALRCEKIHRDKNDFGRELKDRELDLSHLWDGYISLDTVKNNQELTLTSDMLLVSTWRYVSPCMTSYKNLKARIKKIEKNGNNLKLKKYRVIFSFNERCKTSEVNDIYTVEGDVSELKKVGKGSDITLYRENDHKIVTMGFANSYGHYYVEDKNANWVQIKQPATIKEFFSEEQYRKIMKYKLEKDFDSLTSDNGVVRVWNKNGKGERLDI